ncbi:MAG: peptidoglycan-binding protein [Clostridia bacterium]|nr:peptidoglycan-binding protein [Clostridia bacterium]
MPPRTPYIPETITVHLGAPNQPAENVTLSFPDYIKNVASSEVYPTWPESALRANIYAQISFALNRVFTEYYRSRGYDFDITNSTASDQAFFYGRDVFENVSRIVDEIFNSYIVRQGFIEPLFAQYCDGDRVTCPGLSQWGTLSLAEQGYTPYEILTYYYGDDINIVRTDDVRGITASVPPVTLSLGSSGPDVELIQNRLNRIATNYPAIPKIFPVNGVFGQTTEDAVRTFQEVFGLTADGIVGEATWYRIQYIYNAVKRLSDLYSEGLTLSEISTQYPSELSRGSSGQGVEILQYYLRYVADFLPTVPSVTVDGVFGEETEAAVRAFQTAYGLTPDGIVGILTWNRLYNVYLGFSSAVSYDELDGLALPFPGRSLVLGDEGPEVRALQEYLNYLSSAYPDIPAVTPDGVFGPATAAALDAFEERFGLPDARDAVNAAVWNAIAREYDDLYLSRQASDGQYPGYAV